MRRSPQMAKRKKLPSSMDPKVIKAAMDAEGIGHPIDKEIYVLITEVETSFGVVAVYKYRFFFGEHYVVTVDDKVRHPNCCAEDVFRALSNYLHSAAYSANKLKAGCV